MVIEIRFLDRLGRLRCSLSDGFMSCESAARYAREVMKTRMCRHYRSAEIYAPESVFPIVVAHSRNPNFVDLRGQLRRGQGGENVVSLMTARLDRTVRKTRAARIEFRG